MTNPAQNPAQDPIVPVDLTVTTRLFGPVAIAPEQVILFPRGLPGFPDRTRFVLLEAGSPGLQWLQSLDEPALCFLTIPPSRIVPDAWSEFPDARVIVTLPRGSAPASANMRAPLLIDREHRTAQQWIPVECRFRTVHPFDLPALLASTDR